MPYKVLKLLTYLLLIHQLLATSGFASSDQNYCDVSLTLNQINTDGICNNLPFLNPYNDSRANLILLTDNNKAQQATLEVLSSPQNKAPYLNNHIRKDISAVPFELTIYGHYFDDLLYTKYAKRMATAKHLDTATKQLLQQILQRYQNDSSIESKVAYDQEQLLSSPSLIFIQQLATTNSLTDQEKLQLGLARYLLFVNSETDISKYLPINPSSTAKHFVSYLLAANAFYKNNYIQANKYFSEASQANHPWIKETAIYMLARNLLNQGQAPAFNNWGELDTTKTDQTAITASRVAFNNYLKQYPHGMYANSSKGLLRRIYWLQNNIKALANNYENLLENPQLHIDTNTSSKYSIADLILEIDNKIYFNSRSFTARDLTQTPKLLFTYDLLKMRLNKLTLANLSAQKSDFKYQPHLYHLLLANYYTYQKSDPVQVLKLLPALTGEEDNINNWQFSEQVLRALALETQNNWQEAEQLWLALLALAKQPYQAPLIELGLALNYEKSGQLPKVFTKDSKITTPQLRYILLRKNATRAQLQQLATSHEIAVTERAYIIYLLLYKELLTNQYQDFLTDSSLLVSNGVDNVQLTTISQSGSATLELFSNAIPSHPEYNCPSPIILANILKLNSTDARALNCLGEFRRYYQLPFSSYIPASSLANQHLSGALGTNKPTEFGANLYSPLKGYQSVINDPEVNDEDKAFALYKAIRCFAYNGDNRCDKQTISQKERQQWFILLKTKYAKTLWAKQQAIYW